MSESGKEGSGRHGVLTESFDEPPPHLHAKTFLSVLSICMLYFTQNFCIVGAGAVSWIYLTRGKPSVLYLVLILTSYLVFEQQSNTIAALFDDSTSSTWLSAVLAIFTVVLGPIFSQAADYWGRKWFTVVGSFFGGIGAIIVARATSFDMVIGGFCVTGIAFGAQPLLHAVAGEILPRKWRSWGQGLLMMSTGLGLLLGLIVGGALLRDGNADGFRNFSYIVMALFFLSSITLAVAYRPLPLPLQSQLNFGEKMGRLDWVGYGLLASSLVLFCMGLSWSKNPYPWSDPHVSATFAIGVALAIVLIVYETIFKKDGMFHHGLFTTNRNFPIALFCIFCEGVAFFAANVYFAFEVSSVFSSPHPQSNY